MTKAEFLEALKKMTTEERLEVIETASKLIREEEVFSDLFLEIIEDIALEKAIKEGENTETVSREAIFKILDN